MRAETVVAAAISIASCTAAVSAKSFPASASSSSASDCVPVPQRSLCAPFGLDNVNLTAVSLQLPSSDSHSISTASQWSAHLDNLLHSATALNKHLHSEFGCTSQAHLHLDASAVVEHLCLEARVSSVPCVWDSQSSVCPSVCLRLNAFNAVVSSQRLCPTDSLSDTQINNRIKLARTTDSCKDLVTRFWPSTDNSCSVPSPGSQRLLRQQRDGFTNPLKGNAALEQNHVANTRPKFSNFLKNSVFDESNPNAPIEHFLEQKNMNLDAAPGEAGSAKAASTSGLGTGVIVAIATASLVAVVAIVFCITALTKKKKSKKPETEQMIPRREPLSTLASYNNRGGVPSDYSPLAEAVVVKELAPKPRPKILGRQSVVLAYTAGQPDELSLAVGDVVILQEYKQIGWGEGVLERTGKKGVFPLVCVGIVEASSPA
ncbi:hypothetical protein HDU81_008973 [Chytriomyces hyalinus]|nr:hypothetical protein HDU81_008973 [Chytriomyces hyalinus]